MKNIALVKKRGRLGIKGVGYIVTDGIIGHVPLYNMSSYKHDILLGWHRKIDGKEFGQALSKEVPSKYATWDDLLKCIEGISIVEDCISILQNNMKEVLSSRDN